MLTETHEKEIAQIYSEYQNEIKPLVYYIERRYRKFPISLLNGIRDVFDHISRCYRDDVDSNYIDENIMKAKNHFTRIKLDAYKYVYDTKQHDFAKWKRKYNKYDLQNINDGEFWEYVLESGDEADKLFNEAKEQEAIDVNASYELFYQASQKIDDIFQTIKDKRQYIIKAQWKYRKITITNQVIGFIVGILGSIAATFLLKVDLTKIILWLHNLNK